MIKKIIINIMKTFEITRWYRNILMEEQNKILKKNYENSQK